MTDVIIDKILHFCITNLFDSLLKLNIAKQAFKFE